MSTTASFYRTHLLLIPGALAFVAQLSHTSGLDHALTSLFFDAVSNRFPVHTWATLEMLGHRFAKTAIVLIWLSLLASVASTHVWPHWRPAWTAQRVPMWCAVAGMALGPMIVVALKGLNAYHCPWDLVEFGGGAEFSSGWFVAASEVGHCFPGGHAASGFSLVALYFLAREMGSPTQRRLMLALTLLVGTAFSLLRMAQGAHFLSHNLWAAAICWAVAALAFMPLYAQRKAMVTT